VYFTDNTARQFLFQFLLQQLFIFDVLYQTELDSECTLNCGTFTYLCQLINSHQVTQ